MKNWYSRSKDLTLVDGTKVKEYHIVFETTEKNLKEEIEKHLKEIMDRKSVDKRPIGVQLNEAFGNNKKES